MYTALLMLQFSSVLLFYLFAPRLPHLPTFPPLHPLPFFSLLVLSSPPIPVPNSLFSRPPSFNFLLSPTSSFQVKQLFQSLSVKYGVLELDQVENGQDVQNYLIDLTGQKTVPMTFVKGVRQ